MSPILIRPKSLPNRKWKVFAVWTICCLISIYFWEVRADMPEVWCPDDVNTCEFTLVVDYRLTMMKGKELTKVFDGRVYPYDVTNLTSNNAVATDDVITADGYFEPRLVMTFNGTIPGPALHVRAGQIVTLTVINRLMQETNTVHIHGQFQRGTPHSDGVPFVTQCPILPGQTFVQHFTADPEGTFFYHSHVGPQMTNGLYGAFIVHPRISRQNIAYTITNSVTEDYRSWAETVEETNEHVMILQDWNHDWDAMMGTLKMRFGLYAKGKKLPTTHNLAGVSYSAFEFHSGLINGRGRFYNNESQHNGAPLTKLSVQSNKLYRLRLINSGDIHPFRVSIDGHPLLVEASDSGALAPVLVESVIVHPGERFDIIILTSQPVANYWIRAQTLQVGYNHTAEAILHYVGSSDYEEPVSSRETCTQSNPCIVVNCPFLYFPRGSHTTCFNFDKLRAKFSNNLKGLQDRITEVFLNFAFPGDTETPGSVNGRAFVSPDVCPLSQPEEAHLSCPDDQCGEDKICHCPYTISYQHNDLVQLVFLNMGQGRGWDHPIHMHGHSFQVIKTGYPVYNTTTGEFVKENEDITCGSRFCNNASWTNASWSQGSLPDVELERAPEKDNIVVPSGGYVVVRFRADNPGLWLIHCHLDLHSTDGMTALLNESFPLWPPPPSGFPECRSFYGAPGQARHIHLQEYGPR